MMHLSLSLRRDTLLAVSIFGSLVLSGVLAERAHAQKESVKPGINDSFKDPKVTNFVERFEREGREIYDKRNEAVEACGIKEDMAIADVGAGTGLYTRLFAAKTGPKGKVYAVDIAQKFIDHIVRSCQEEKLNNVVGVVCKADSVELPANSVDLVFICDTYHHFEFPQSTMRTIHAALRPGGIVCLVDFERIEEVSSAWTLGHVRVGKEGVRKEVEEAGFELVDEVKGLFKDNFFLKFRKR
ncbi:MAG: class I SAM-dependent methyltransferase [Pirellulaceae bacterium]